MTKWRVHFYQIVKTHSLVVCLIKFVSQEYCITTFYNNQVLVFSMKLKKKRQGITLPLLMSDFPNQFFCGVPNKSRTIFHLNVLADGACAPLHAPCDLRRVAQLVIEPVHFHDLRGRYSRSHDYLDALEDEAGCFPVITPSSDLLIASFQISSMYPVKVFCLLSSPVASMMI